MDTEDLSESKMILRWFSISSSFVFIRAHSWLKSFGQADPRPKGFVPASVFVIVFAQ